MAGVLVRIVVQPWWVCRSSNISYSSYIGHLSGNVLRCLGLIVACFVLVSWGLKPDYMHLLSSAACATCLYAAGAWIVIFDRNDRLRFRSALTRKTGKAQPAVASTAALSA